MESLGYNWYMGHVIRYLRQRKGLKQSEYAVRVGKIQSSISRIESGKQGIAAKELSRFAGPLGIQASDLATLASHCFATYKQSDSCQKRYEKIRKLCDARLGIHGRT